MRARFGIPGFLVNDFAFGVSFLASMDSFLFGYGTQQPFIAPLQTLMGLVICGATGDNQIEEV